MSWWQWRTPRGWPKIDEVLDRIDAAGPPAGVASGVAMDQYPYTAGCATLAIIVPRWATEGGTAALQRRLADPVTRGRIHRQVSAQDPADLARGLRAFEPENIVVATVPTPRCWRADADGGRPEDDEPAGRPAE